MKFSTDVVQVVKELAQILVLLACLIVNFAASRDVNALFLMVLFETILEIVFLRLNVRLKILQVLQVSRFLVQLVQDDSKVRGHFITEGQSFFFVEEEGVLKSAGRPWLVC
jgi:hypothetical protein